ncbi:MAG: deoxyribose-phosphate aldolase [Bacteroidota bacterium]
MDSSIDRALCALIDHTLLRPDAVGADIDRLCQEARAFGFRTVCVQPVFVARAACNLAGSPVGVSAVVAFPHGAATTAAKAFETRRALDDGATEIDVVANLGWIAADTAADDGRLTDEVARIVDTAAGAPVKVILECALFSDARKEAAARAVVAARAASVKTSTGYGPGGATVHDVALLRRVVGADTGVKASGGIKTRALAQALVAAGASRIGASASIALVTLPHR